jgi:hypothetical protein
LDTDARHDWLAIIRATRASNFSRPDLILGDWAKIESDFAVLGMNLDCAGSQSFDKRK